MTSPTTGGSGIRLGGLASGFDTEAIVESLLAVDQQRIDDLNEQVSVNSAKIQTWEDLAEQLRTLADTVTKLRAGGTSGQTLFDDKIVSSSSSSVATGVATSSAIKATYNIDVTTLARGQVVYGNQKASGYTNSTAGNFTINGVTITLDGTETLQGVADKINLGGYSPGEEIVANVIDSRLVIQTKNTGADQEIYGSTKGASPPFAVGDDPVGILASELELIDGSRNFNSIAQTSSDSSLSINGVPVSLSTNTIDGAIRGLTVTVTSTGTTDLTISHNTKAVKDTISDYVDLYNETRDLIDRVRSAKIDEEDLFGLFANDPLMRQMYGEIRSLTTGGVTMVSGEWEGSLTAQAAAANDTSITIDGLSNATANLNLGDKFVIVGHSQTYEVTSSTMAVGGSATLSIQPPLEQAVTLGDSVAALTQTLEEIGVGVETTTVSGVAGILGIIDEAKLDAALASNMDTVKALFSKYDASRGDHAGVGRRLYDWIDSQIKISAFVSKTRSIEDVQIPGIESRNEGLEEQITRLERALERKRTSLIRQFAEMENAISQTQSAGAALGQLGGGG